VSFFLRFAAAIAFVSASFAAEPALPAHSQVKSLKITVLSTMLADANRGQSFLGEWGFSALVEVDGHRILFDTGAHDDIVLRNAQSMGLDLTTVPDVVLSHSHSDHTTGFLPLRASVVAKNSTALARTHVAEGMFYPRLAPDTNPVLVARPDYERGGGVFVVHRNAEQIHPGVWVTGPVPRKHPEFNFPRGGTSLVTPSGRTEDNLPEDMSLIFDTPEGLVILTGCGHAGCINIVDHARNTVRPARVHALIGGLHLFNAKEETLKWTADRLRAVGVDHFLGAHCTGIETVYRYRKELGLDRAHAVVAGVGSSFELGKGIDPGSIAK
jgi:7,8-dihydropterin-6-yl-methyl-4-(beta-D-ribofuranosyl)aminobenzene 5'-phosphate synthase